MSWVYQVPGLDGLLESRVGLDAEEGRRANVIGGCKCGLKGFACQPHGTVTRLDGSVVHETRRSAASPPIESPREWVEEAMAMQGRIKAVLRAAAKVGK